jgi:hypothetical protein
MGRPVADIGAAGRGPPGMGPRAAGRGTSVGPVGGGVAARRGSAAAGSPEGRVGRGRSVERDEMTRPGIGVGAVAGAGSGAGASTAGAAAAAAAGAWAASGTSIVSAGSAMFAIVSGTWTMDSSSSGELEGGVAVAAAAGAGVAAGASSAASAPGSAVFLAPAFLAAFLTGLGSSGCSSRISPSRSALRRTRSAWASMMLDEWVLTPMPRSRQRSRHSLLVSPSSLASSCTRSFGAKIAV